MLERRNRVPRMAHDRIDLGIPPVVVNSEPFAHFGGLLDRSSCIPSFSLAWNSRKEGNQVEAKRGHDPSYRIRDLVRIGEAIHLFRELERGCARTQRILPLTHLPKRSPGL
jgi:hypothetical protein